MTAAATEPDTHAAAAELELLSGLLRCGSRWPLAKWHAVLAWLPGNYRRVVVLRLLHGMEWARIGERLGFSRGRGPQVFESAMKRLKPHLEGEA